MEDIITVLEREVHDVPLDLLAVTHACSLLFSICWHFHLVLLYIAVPQLTACPRNVLLAEHTAVVCHSACHRVTVDGENMVVLHDVLVTIVILHI